MTNLYALRRGNLSPFTGDTVRSHGISVRMGESGGVVRNRSNRQTKGVVVNGQPIRVKQESPVKIGEPFTAGGMTFVLLQSV